CSIRRKSAIRAEARQIRCDFRASWIGHAIERCCEVLSKLVAIPAHLTFPWKVPDDVRRSSSVDRRCRNNIQRGSSRHVENRSELPSFNHARNDAVGFLEE